MSLILQISCAVDDSDPHKKKLIDRTDNNSFNGPKDNEITLVNQKHRLSQIEIPHKKS
jgi:hypothetical protein